MNIPVQHGLQNAFNNKENAAAPNKLALNLGKVTAADQQQQPFGAFSDRSQDLKKQQPLQKASILQQKRPLTQRPALSNLPPQQQVAAVPQQSFAMQPQQQVQQKPPMMPLQQKPVFPTTSIAPAPISRGAPTMTSIIPKPVAQTQPAPIVDSHEIQAALQALKDAPSSLSKQDFAYREAEPHHLESNPSNPRFATDFLPEIFEHLKNNETKFVASPNYMDRQTEITSNMRAVLLDWLIDVHNKFQLMPETLYLTVNIIDRFLDLKHVTKQKLQLIGVTALLLSSKYEEIMCPDVNEFAQITAGAYTKDEILKTEKLMLGALDFNVTVATPHTFLKTYLKAARADLKTQFVANYLAELAALDYKMLKYVPSIYACACIYVARKCVGVEDAWDFGMQSFSGYYEDQIRAVASNLVKLVEKEKEGRSKLTAVKKKYSGRKRLEMSKIIPNLVNLPCLREFASL